MGYGGERLCIDLAWGSFLVYENDGLPWYAGVVIHGRMPAIGVEHDGCARFRSETPVAGHTLLKQRPGIRSGPALMACRHIGEFLDGVQNEVQTRSAIRFAEKCTLL